MSWLPRMKVCLSPGSRIASAGMIIGGTRLGASSADGLLYGRRCRDWYRCWEFRTECQPCLLSTAQALTCNGVRCVGINPVLVVTWLYRTVELECIRFGLLWHNATAITKPWQ